MPLSLIQEEVDIYLCPTLDERCLTFPRMEVTIGDLHGHTLKLLFLLVKHGIIESIFPSDYEILVAIYQRPVEALGAEHLAAFSEILRALKFNPKAPHLRLLGDECADRGNNDYFTLKLFERMHHAGVSFEILLSNHGMEFIRTYETFFSKDAPLKPFDYKPEIMAQPFVVSLKNLIELFNRDLVSFEELQNLVEESYKLHLKLIAYTKDEYQSHVSLYSHAPIGLESLGHIAECFHLEFDDTSIETFLTSLDLINDFILDAVRSNRLLYWHDKDDLDLLNLPSSSKLATFEFFLWNRNYHYLSRPQNHAKGFELHFVHGHDSAGPPLSHVTCLDNFLGKSKELNRGLYTVLYSNIPRSLELNVDKAKTVMGRFEVFDVVEPSAPIPIHKSASAINLNTQLSPCPLSLLEITSQLSIFVEVIRIEIEAGAKEDSCTDLSKILAFSEELEALTRHFVTGHIKLEPFYEAFLAYCTKYKALIAEHPETMMWMSEYKHVLLQMMKDKKSLVTIEAPSMLGLFKAPKLEDEKELPAKAFSLPAASTP